MSNKKNSLVDFLKGNLFSNNLEITVQSMPYILRIELIEKLCEEKRLSILVSLIIKI